MDNRINLEPVAAYPDWEIAVGYDPPLRSFFAMVDDGTDIPIVFIGTSLQEIGDPAAVIDAVREYAVIPPDLTQRLHDMRAARPTTEPDHLEAAIARMQAEGNLSASALIGRLFSHTAGPGSGSAVFTASLTETGKLFITGESDGDLAVEVLDPGVIAVADSLGPASAAPAPDMAVQPATGLDLPQSGLSGSENTSEGLEPG